MLPNGWPGLPNGWAGSAGSSCRWASARWSRWVRTRRRTWWAIASSGSSTAWTRSSTPSGRRGPSPRHWWTWFARAVALLWELAADALIAVPLLGYEQRDPAAEWKLGRELLQRTRSPLRLVRPAATLLVAIAGACSVARTVQGSLHLALHVGWLASLARAATLVGLLVLLAPRAGFRSLELARTSRYRAVAAVVLVPLMIAAVLSFR